MSPLCIPGDLAQWRNKLHLHPLKSLEWYLVAMDVLGMYWLGPRSCSSGEWCAAHTAQYQARRSVVWKTLIKALLQKEPLKSEASSSCTYLLQIENGHIQATKYTHYCVTLYMCTFSPIYIITWETSLIGWLWFTEWFLIILFCYVKTILIFISNLTIVFPIHR